MNKPTTYKLTINQPVTMSLKYIDVWPNNPANNFGASLCLTGDIDGQYSRVYATGKLYNVLVALEEGGVIASYDHPHDPANKYSIKPISNRIEIKLSQEAGENYKTFQVKSLSGSPPKAPAAPARQQSTQSTPEAEQTLPSPSKKMLAAYSTAIEIVELAQSVAKEKGMDVSFSGEDIRSTAISLFIEMKNWYGSLTEDIIPKPPAQTTSKQDREDVDRAFEGADEDDLPF